VSSSYNPYHTKVYLLSSLEAHYFHGGGYIVGSRAMLGSSHIEALNEAGFVVVSSDYRLCPTISVLEGPVADSVAAYEWSQNELPKLLAKSHNIDVDGKNIVTLGHSCGGGLALLMVSVSHPCVVLNVVSTYTVYPGCSTQSPKSHS
jgi:acetyl esterase/lipase